MSEPEETLVSPPRCVVCSRLLVADEVQSCLRCLGRVRRELARVPDLVALLPGSWGPASQRLDSGRGSGERALPGGDSLVMLGPGSDARDAEARRDDAPAVLFELDRWCVDWAELRDEASPWPVTLVGACSWLSVRAGWAAGQHPAFDEFAGDLARIVSRLEGASGDSTPTEAGAPCLSCGASLERHYADRRRHDGCWGHPDRCPWPYEHHGCADHGGREDDWRCPRCRRVYDDDEYRLAVAQRFALVRAGLVTADVLAETLGVREERLRQWASRGHIGRHGKDERGRTLYDPDEVRARALAVGLLRSA